MTRAIIALLTDFGLSDHFVGAMKAVILGINPEAAIIDITHEVPPQAVEAGAFTLNAVVPFLPAGTVCVAVVDPGVGTARTPIALQTPRGTFVGPDNGLLSAALSDEQRPPTAAAGEPDVVAVPGSCQAVELSNAEFFRSPVSSTFHGRDIFAPVGAHLSRGAPLSAAGRHIHSLLAFPCWRAARLADGSLRGRIVAVDHFGNLITDIRTEDAGGDLTETEVGGVSIGGIGRTYQDSRDSRGLLVYVGSSGYLEIGRRNGDAARTLGAQAGTPVRVRLRARGRDRETEESG